MGKKLYKKEDVSYEKTAALGIGELQVINDGGDSQHYVAVHNRYFQKGRCVCPACGSQQTRSSKVVRRKLKDIIYCDEDNYEVIDLIFYQRYMRCNKCHNSVFPEEVTFAKKGCRYTNRLADKLADGTFEHSYQKVCDHYGVPASTASVGEIMRRRIKDREKSMFPLRAPEALCIVMVEFYGVECPLIIGIWNSKIYCMDILSDTSEETCSAFFGKLKRNAVKTVYVDPVDSLYSAANNCFPTANVVVSGEAILRYARNAMMEVIRSDGKRFPIMKKYWALTEPRSLGRIDSRIARNIEDGMKKRPRLRQAYNLHQSLMEKLDGDWSVNELKEWVTSIPNEITEFDVVKDIVEYYEPEITRYLEIDNQLKNDYRFQVQGICDAIKEMPKCIFDVLRGRCFFNTDPDNVSIDGVSYRYGINSKRFRNNIIEITKRINEEKYL